MQILSKAGLKCKPHKCRLFCASVHYLGYVISPEGVAPEREKIDKIGAWPFPQTGTDMLSFLGLLGYYRKFVPNIGTLAAPLYEAAREKILKPTEELRMNFEKLKQIACSIPTVRLPDPTKPFILETDASAVAVGAVLKQKDEDGTEYPVQWYSQGLSKSERNYSVYERELLAVVKSASSLRV